MKNTNDDQSNIRAEFNRQQDQLVKEVLAEMDLKMLMTILVQMDNEQSGDILDEMAWEKFLKKAEDATKTDTSKLSIKGELHKKTNCHLRGT